MRKEYVSSIGRALAKAKGCGFESHAEAFLFVFHYIPKGEEEDEQFIEQVEVVSGA